MVVACCSLLFVEVHCVVIIRDHSLARTYVRGGSSCFLVTAIVICYLKHLPKQSAMVNGDPMCAALLNCVIGYGLHLFQIVPIACGASGKCYHIVKL